MARLRGYFVRQLIGTSAVRRAVGLAAATADAKRSFRADAATAEFAAPPRGGTDGDMSPDELEFTSQGHALLHVLEEVTQHLGQMELTRDVLRAAGTAPG